jgi:succinyl-diaminopimelate desuccinylase
MNEIELLKEIVSKKSVTPNDGDILEFIKHYLSDFKAKKIEKNGVKNLFLYKEFDSQSNFHLCLAGHVDVVPAGDLAEWETEPFIATEKIINNKKYIYGRGTQDMKSGISAIVTVAKNLKSFNGTLSLLLTSDEEGDADYGTIEVLRQLEKENFLPNAVLVAEPTSEKKFGDAIKIGRRGSITGRLKIHGKQGHVAYPQQAINPIHQAGEVLQKIAGYQLDNGDDFFAPSQLIITNINGGLGVENVTPDSLEIVFNSRVSTLTNREKIKNYIDEVCKNLNFELELKQYSEPFLTNSDSQTVNNLSQAVEDILGKKPKLSTAGGTSDARFFVKFKNHLTQKNIEVVEIGVINDRIHAINERVEISEVQELTQVIEKFVSKF